MIHGVRSVVLLTIIWVACVSTLAQAQSASILQSLERPGDFRSMRSSSADKDWRNGNADARPILPGQTLTIAELEGPGRIAHIWFTIAAQDRFYPRSMTLRIYWDGDKDPAVESPIGDFFAVGHGVDVPVSSFPVAVSSDGKARNCYWSMPFAKSARITVSNDSATRRVDALYYYVDWQKLPSLPPETMYFHAQYRQEFPCKSGEDYLILDAEGDGAYVGTVLSVQMSEESWFGEGDDRFYIDGEAEPSLRGTGTEDYFCDGWGFRHFNNPFYGVSLWEGFGVDDRGTAYRWHIPDPVRFKKALKVTIEHKGVSFRRDGKVKSGFEERPDSFSSVAFWYQRGKAKRFTQMPPAAERLVRGAYVEAETLMDRLWCEPAAAQVQDMAACSAGKQIHFTPYEPKAWIELPFDVPDDGRYALKVDLGHARDYGIYEIQLDGVKVGDAVNLYSPDFKVTTEKLGIHQFKKGSHKLRFVCTGTDAQSKARQAGQSGYGIGIDALSVRKLMSRE
jgi:hypothetical protein